jgi:calcineurin-like phosphoesterase family protein
MNINQINKHKVWFTSDTHFGHQSILKFTDRGHLFENVASMDKAMIEAWNKVVGPKDFVIHLGDFFMYAKNAYAREVINQLNGGILLVMGNHDSETQMKSLARYFKDITIMGDPKFQFVYGQRFNYDGLKFELSHYPQMLGMERSDMVSIHGHIHQHEPEFPYMINVGVDATNEFRHGENRRFGTPISLEELTEAAKKRLAFKSERYTKRIREAGKPIETSQPNWEVEPGHWWNDYEEWRGNQ